MAVATRSRKAAAPTPAGEVGAVKTPNKTTTKGKRKAAEDISPATTKQQKSTKKTSISKRENKSEPEESLAVQEQEQEQTGDQSSESEGNGDGGVLALAEELDSGDEEQPSADSDALFKPGQDVGKIPQTSNTVQKGGKKDTGERGVVYIGRVPHGFYEHEMKQYFSQFGPVTRLRLSRNKRTGQSKHFAFIEFEDPETADIVAKTMDNYLLFGHILKCKALAKEQVHDDLFKGANRRFKKVPWNKMAGKQLEKPRSETAWKNKLTKEQKKRDRKAAKWSAMGYNFEAPQLKDVPTPAPIESGDADVKALEAAPAEADDSNANGAPEDKPEAEVLVSKPAKAQKGKATKTKKLKA